MRLVAAKDAGDADEQRLKWLYRVTTNLCLNRLRKRRTHPVVTDPDAVRRLAAGDRSEEDRQTVLQILGRTDLLSQRIAVHYYLDGMKMEEVAEMVGYSRKTVSKKLSAFRAHAARQLEGAR